MKKSSFVLFLLLTSPFLGKGQATVHTFSEDQLLWFVEKYHPLSQQADLLLKRGESTIRQAKGGFDPVLSGEFDQKSYDEKNYYSLLHGGLKIPTWYGVEVKTGYDQNSGIRLNPEDNVPSGGLWYGGVSVTLGNGLFIDQRRATIKQAQIFAESTYAQQRQVMNDLYFDALKAYWNWVEAYNQFSIYDESLNLAVDRFEAVKSSFRFGDKPAIDTLEAFILVQNRQLHRSDYEVAYKNATLALSNYLWFENNTPLLITDSLIPVSITELPKLEVVTYDTLEASMLRLDWFHPEMQLYGFKLADMNIDRRLKSESLKPTVNVHYNVLNEPIGGSVISGLDANNSKMGVSAGFPLFLRKQRGDLQLTDIKIQETQLSQQQKLLELQNTLRQFYNQQLVLASQVELYTNSVANSERLLAGERQKFRAGESSVFMVNTRENYAINARLKLIELIAKYHVYHKGVTWASGGLYSAN